MTETTGMFIVLPAKIRIWAVDKPAQFESAWHNKSKCSEGANTRSSAKLYSSEFVVKQCAGFLPRFHGDKLAAFAKSTNNVDASLSSATPSVF